LCNERGREEQSAADWGLIRLVGAGDQIALERLYKQYYRDLYRFILQVTRRADFVEDVINEVMLVVWERAADAVPRSKASTWILGIAHNKSMQALRRGRTALGQDDYDDQTSGQDAGFGEMETQEVMFALMRALSPEQRAVMELVYYHGLHYTEIAQMIDCPENTVKTRVFHARKKLRDLWPDLTGSRAPDAIERHRR